MNEVFYHNEKQIVNALKEIWDYMHLEQTIENVDLIIGCGCSDLDIPLECARLWKKGFAPKILFTGGLGKITKDSFYKPEAVLYKEIAMENGVKEEDIFVEMHSTNTGDNFRFSIKLLEEMNYKYNNIIIVHAPFNLKRTYSCAKIFLKDKKLIMSSFIKSFDVYIKELKKKDAASIYNDISVIVGDVQRMIVYPQFGWQIENDVPENVIKSYTILKDLGFTKFIMSTQDIKDLICKVGVLEGMEENYFN